MALSKEAGLLCDVSFAATHGADMAMIQYHDQFGELT
jgi:hypothetical protein